MYAIRKAKAVSHNSPRIITFRNFKRFNADKFKSDLHSVAFHIVETFDDPNTAWSMWKDMFIEVCNKHAPTMPRKVRGEQCPWLKDQLKERMRKGDTCIKSKEKYYKAKLNENKNNPKGI